MFGYRIAPGHYPIFDATGAALWGGRWNSPGRRVIYAAETYAAAMLETLVHVSHDSPPPGYLYVRIEIPEEVSVETMDEADLEGWAAEDMRVSRAFGDRSIEEKRSAVLRVPSVVTQGAEANLVIDVEHPDFRLIKAESPRPVRWDARLFQRETARR